VVAMVPLPAINSFVIKKWYDNLANLELLEDDEEGSIKKEEFLQLLNRGGLVTPSDLVYLTCMHALQLKAELFDDDYTQELFFASSFPQAVFVNILTKKISNTSASDSIFGQVCDSPHSFQAFVPSIAAKFFNCMSKNFVQSINDKIHAGRKRGNVKESSSVRNIAKLQS
ncbi:Putative LOC101234561, partial [Caligus rogercresseyi]